MSIIAVSQLVKRYGDLAAVDGISFEVAPGELFGFLGPNGAGKTTTIHLLCTLLTPTSGRASLAGYDCVREPHRVREAIGLLFQDTTLDHDLTAWENLVFHAALYNLDRATARDRIARMLDLVGLADRQRDLVRKFSGGMKRRLEIARGLLHYPKVLFLDEPTIGLDPQSRHHLWGFLHTLRKQREMTLFMTTHYMEEAEQCDRIAVIDHGRIIALGTPGELKRLVKGEMIYLTTADNARAVPAIREVFGLDAREEGGRLYLEVDEGEAFIPLLIRRLPVAVLSVSLHKPTLNEVFLHLTGRAIRAEEADALDVAREAVRARRRRDV
ncbi:MAG: ABC transporter ATP-binding protein [Nitrospirae bacterium]|nr:ABC transporter ATP-binding protein [Nitrospirota bacterium]